MKVSLSLYILKSLIMYCNCIESTLTSYRLLSFRPTLQKKLLVRTEYLSFWIHKFFVTAFSVKPAVESQLAKSCLSRSVRSGSCACDWLLWDIVLHVALTLCCEQKKHNRKVGTEYEVHTPVLQALRKSPFFCRKPMRKEMHAGKTHDLIYLCLTITGY